MARYKPPQYERAADSADRQVKKWAESSGTGCAIECSVYTAVERLHAAFPWLSRRGLAVLAANQTGRYLFVCQSAVSRLAREGKLGEVGR